MDSDVEIELSQIEKYCGVDQRDLVEDYKFW